MLAFFKGSRMNVIELKDLNLVYNSSGFQIGPKFNLAIQQGDFVGLVGESGCGKSSLGKVLIGLINQDERENFGIRSLSGDLNFHIPLNKKGINYLDTSYKNLQELRRDVQMIFQNPRSALNLKMPVISTLMEAAKIGNPNLDKASLLKIIYEKVIRTQFLNSNVSFDDFLKEKKILASNGSLSGGERRRVSIAKVMCMNPSIIIADEPLASLDASIKLDILNYIKEEWKERQKSNNPLTLILISHDIGVVSNVCNRVIIMFGDLINKNGKIVEEFNAPRKFKLEVNKNYHEYTNELIEASKYFSSGD
ncbi:MAG: hypothetical protein CMG09_05765 [Candidatus Marinimicrobia bacterium]|nr:hypothetical protein [Candidatus Neomarinimicrobiota bacterium]|tara:strand:- start:7231 stop:8154 length:924 start_codon:yes stop_codon:yes gene_type:complete